ncbi:MAG: terminase small subunit [Candidatus Omnitrophota bacterium]
MNKPTTPKQRMFLRELIKTFSPTEAAWRVYRCKDRMSARNIGSENLVKLGITLTELMDKGGLDINQDFEDLKRLRQAKKPVACDVMIHDDNGKLTVNKNSNDWIEVDDNQTQLKALELSLKLKGVLKENTAGQNTQNNVNVVIVRDNARIKNPIETVSR